MKKIVVFGSTGLLGKPVTQALIEAGFAVTVMVRNENLAKKLFPKATIIKGDLKNESDVEKAIAGQEGIFLSLSVLQTEKENEWHTEQQGLDTIIKIARTQQIKRIGYLSSLVHLYQGMNGFDWWVFRIKQEAVRKIKESGIAYTIFYPSTFMESIAYQARQGDMIALGGKSAYPLYYIAAEDYAQQVANSFKILHDENKDYIVQGPEAFTQDEAAKVFIKYYTKEKLRTLWAPMFLMKIMGLFTQKFNYGYHIVTALNKYPEKFEASQTWEELGKPTITLKAFAEKIGER
ncbi:SDR family oxidoreductase [Emticicia agri]|uniref:NAD-dependent epimerase/dehydratase family protein n=1 Tax=Emticicia agri TaxID=2492393 RepID=A0A4Q5M1G0_9BACT|nr:NAD(P)H-binding protein [Emticicia agri]RYU96061.1 NAD-dependent epimerase/dehydratase family protein [Emticicia agri]